MADIKERIINTIADVLKVSPEAMTGKDDFQEIENWDSLRHLNLVLNLEKEFGVKFSVDEIVRISSISAVEEIVNSKMS